MSTKPSRERDAGDNSKPRLERVVVAGSEEAVGALDVLKGLQSKIITEIQNA